MIGKIFKFKDKTFQVKRYYTKPDLLDLELNLYECERYPPYKGPHNPIILFTPREIEYGDDHE